MCAEAFHTYRQPHTQYAPICKSSCKQESYRLKGWMGKATKKGTQLSHQVDRRRSGGSERGWGDGKSEDRK